jgi:RNA polymerase sigma-70 factor (ECF subfamily)
MERGEEFDALYRTCRDRLVTQLLALSGDRFDAADAVQEAFLRAWVRWDRIATYDDPEGWVRCVAYHLAVSRWRQARRLVLRATAGRDDYEMPTDQLMVINALKALPLSQRKAIVLHHLGGLSVDETAAELQAPVGTVKSWLYRGRARLAVALGPESLEVAP